MPKIIIRGKKLDIVTLDFETFYSNQYSLRLKRYTTSGYIRDPQFKAHGVGMILDDAYHWITSDIHFRLKCIDWENTALLCQNTPFDAFILAHHYDIHPAFMLDTAAMSRLYWGIGYKHDLDTLAQRHGLPGKVNKQSLMNSMGKRDLEPHELESLGIYCGDDCIDTLEVFKQLYKHTPDTELRLIDLTTRLFTKSPLRVNHALATEELEAQRAQKHEKIELAGVDVATLMSNDKFAELLKAIGIEPPTKISARTGKEAWAFAKSDAGFQLLLEHDDPMVVAIAEARVAVKSTIGESRAQRLIDETQNGWYLPVGLTHAAAKTHRWGGTNKCLAGDTIIIVWRDGEMFRVPITDLQDDDLVFDGDEFVQHAGLLKHPPMEVITYDGITATPNHKCYTNERESFPLEHCAAQRLPIYRLDIRKLDAATQNMSSSKYLAGGMAMNKSKHMSNQPAVVQPVYDILNCGPRNRFIANDRLVSNSNLQNLPRQKYHTDGSLDMDTGRLRRAIEVDEGFVIVVRDSSQIEVRTLAWWAGQDDLLEDFRNNVDIYKKMASRVFNKTIEDITKEERFIGKCLILGLGYGMGAYKLMMTLAMGILGPAVQITIEQAEHYVFIYRSSFPFITQSWRIADRMINVMIHGGELTHMGVTAVKGELRFPNGTRIRYRGIQLDERTSDIFYLDARNNKIRLYGSILVENIIQKLSRDVVGKQLLEMDDLPNSQVVTMTHDECVMCTPTDNADILLNQMGDIMAIPPTWAEGIPLASEGGWARNYSK